MSKSATRRGWPVELSDDGIETRLKGWQVLNIVVKKLNLPNETVVLGFKIHVDILNEMAKYYARLSNEQISDLLLAVKSELVDFG